MLNTNWHAVHLSASSIQLHVIFLYVKKIYNNIHVITHSVSNEQKYEAEAASDTKLNSNIVSTFL